VTMKLASVTSSAASQAAQFSIRVRRSGGGGYTLNAYDCDYTACLVLNTVHSPTGLVLNEVSADPGDSLVPGTQLEFQVRGDGLYGYRQDNPNLSFEVRARDGTHALGGFVSLYAPAGNRISVAEFAITALE
jgi:hypothetical protein